MLPNLNIPDFILSLVTDIETANEQLRDFPYYKNYVDLIRMETNAIAMVNPDRSLHKFAILGSGPLPLSAFCLRNSLMGNDVKVTNVDRDSLAIATSSEMSLKLGYNPDQVCFQCVDVQEQTIEFAGFDVVCLASLVGSTSLYKKSIIRNVVGRMKPGALLLLRSSHSLRSLLYPVSLDDASFWRQKLSRYLH